MKVGCRRIIGRGFSCCTCTIDTVDALVSILFLLFLQYLSSPPDDAPLWTPAGTS